MAVATGAAFAALDSDTAGSVRLPAAFCGVSGLEAHHGSLTVDGILPLAPSMDSAGALARSAEDLAVVRDVLKARGPAPASITSESAHARRGRWVSHKTRWSVRRD